MQSKAPTVAAYLAELPAERRATIAAVRRLVRRNLPEGYKERMAWGMIAYELPLSVYPDTYNGYPLCFAAIASQKNHCTLHLMHAYGGSRAAKVLVAGFKKAGKKLDMGQCCVRFGSLDDLPLDVIATVIAGTPPEAFIAQYEAGQKRRRV